VEECHYFNITAKKRLDEEEKEAVKKYLQLYLNLK